MLASVIRKLLLAIVLDTLRQGHGTPARAPGEGPRQTQRPAIHAGRLDKNANNFGNRSENVDFTRIDRWVARGVLWEVSSLPRVKKCGRVTVRGSGHVDVRKTADAVGFAGLHTCGSVWACMVCNAKIQAVRRLELGNIANNVSALGKSLISCGFRPLGSPGAILPLDRSNRCPEGLENPLPFPLR